MAYRVTCAHCGITGFLRVEHVVIGHRSVTQFYCGKCEHTWTVAEDGQERRAKPRPIRSTSREKPERL